MAASRRQFLNHGASILSALVFVAILSGVAVGFEYLSPFGNPEAHMAAGEVAQKEIKQECKAGYVNVVSITNGKFQQVQDKPIQCWKNDASGKSVPASTDEKCKETTADKCEVVACLPANIAKGGEELCATVGVFDPRNATQVEAFNKLQNATPADWVKTMRDQDTLDAFPYLKQGMSAADQKALNDAFSDPLKEIQTGLKNQITDNETAIKGIQAAIDNCQYGSLEPSCTSSNLKEWQDQQKQLKEKNEELLATLRDAQTSLKPTGQPDQEVVCTLSNPPICKYPDGRPAPVPGPATPQNPTNPNGTFNGNSNPLSSLMNSLGRGLTQSPVAPPAPPAQPCSTDQNAYAQQQQQYQQALQQYNYQQQVYNQQQQQASLYGTTAPIPPQQPVACTPSTGSQCQSQPQQPPASACSAGSWQPVYNGACIANWRCLASNASAPTATISCEPELADVGAPIVITYGCSSGVASSSSFRVTTQPAGSATTTIANPPAGTNTATYTLACTEGGKTVGAQCSIRVSRPSIILVANPRTVASGGTSLLSWITTGMRSCITSSPDQADFTARNSSNTSVGGAAETSAIGTSARFLLHCETLAGSVRDATTTISVAQ